MLISDLTQMMNATSRSGAFHVLRLEINERAKSAFAKPMTITEEEWQKVLSQYQNSNELAAALRESMHTFISRIRCRAIAKIAFERGEFALVIKAGTIDGDVGNLANVIQLAVIAGLTRERLSKQIYKRRF